MSCFHFSLLLNQFRLPVKQASLSHEHYRLRNVDNLQTMKSLSNEWWVFVAREDTVPRLIFPATMVVLKPPSNNPSSVSFTLKVEDDAQIFVKFDHDMTSDYFRQLVTQGHLMVGF